MKKFMMIAIIWALSSAVMAQNLPFIGQKTFNFSPFPEEQHLIEIKVNGEMSVILPEIGTTLYQGMYQPLFPVYNALGELSGYYQFDGTTAINALNEYKELEIGCNPDNDYAPCQAKFYDVTP